MNYLKILQLDSSLRDSFLSIDKFVIISKNISLLKKKDFEKVYFGMVMEDMRHRQVSQILGRASEGPAQSPFCVGIHQILDENLAYSPDYNDKEKFSQSLEHLRLRLGSKGNKESKIGLERALNHFLNLDPNLVTSINSQINSLQEKLNKRNVFIFDMRIHKFYLSPAGKVKMSVPFHVIFRKKSSRQQYLEWMILEFCMKETILGRLAFGIISSFEDEQKKDFEMRVFSRKRDNLEKLLIVLKEERMNTEMLFENLRNDNLSQIFTILLIRKNLMLRFEILFGQRSFEIQDRKDFEDLNQDLKIFMDFLIVLFNSSQNFKTFKLFRELCLNVIEQIDISFEINQLKKMQIIPDENNKN